MNKYILGIDTTTEMSSIALNDQGMIWLGNRNQSRDLLPKIEKFLASNKVNFDDLKGVVVVNGPGSYTGIRIGVSVANSLGMVLKIPVKAVDGLFAQFSIFNFQFSIGRSKNINYYSIISAGGTRVYGRRYELRITNYELRIGEESGYFVGEVEDYLADLRAEDLVVGEVGREVREKLRIKNYELREGKKKLQMTNDKLRGGNVKYKVESVKSKLKVVSDKDIVFLNTKNNKGRAWGAVQIFEELPVCKNNIAIPMYLREAVRKI